MEDVGLEPAERRRKPSGPACLPTSFSRVTCCSRSERIRSRTSISSRAYARRGTPSGSGRTSKTRKGGRKGRGMSLIGLTTDRTNEQRSVRPMETRSSGSKRASQGRLSNQASFSLSKTRTFRLPCTRIFRNLASTSPLKKDSKRLRPGSRSWAPRSGSAAPRSRVRITSSVRRLYFRNAWTMVSRRERSGWTRSRISVSPAG